MAQATAAPTVMALKPMAVLIAWGTILWAIGVVILRWLASIDGLHGTTQLVAYALVIVGTVPLIPLTPRLAGLPSSETVGSVAVVAMTALLIDGIVIGYFPALYSADPALARGCAGALLWAVGVALALGFIMQPRGR
ncbi:MULTISPECIES: hypothetical protein [Sphingomonas]|uniref:hypothetical protein n=1 Tax=Sphingomonas TaxID=13687 RepID=UPI000AEE6245|nr:hypothetical protein [Sphingomonas sp. CCH10-B3]